jgi:hypothetical protein
MRRLRFPSRSCSRLLYQKPSHQRPSRKVSGAAASYRHVDNHASTRRSHPAGRNALLGLVFALVFGGFGVRSSRWNANASLNRLNQDGFNGGAKSKRMQETLEAGIWELTRPLNDQYPRPWMTDSTDPASAKVFVIGKNQAKGFQIKSIRDHKRHIDALYNRSGETCRGLYDEITGGKPSPTRPISDYLLASSRSVACARYSRRTSFVTRRA